MSKLMDERAPSPGRYGCHAITTRQVDRMYNVSKIITNGTKRGVDGVMVFTERDYVTFGSLLSQFRLSSVCL